MADIVAEGETDGTASLGSDVSRGDASRTPQSTSSDSAESVLELREVTSGYGDLEAIRGVCLTIRPGEVTALFGANGAGKTTTLLAAVNMLPRKSGEVLLDGRPCRSSLHAMSRRGVMFVPCAPSIIKKLSVRDNLKLGRGGVDDAVAYFPELEALLRRPAGLLSGGEQQMLALSRALATRPRALLVDELSLGLAPLIVDRLLATLSAASRARGVAVLIVEQQARRALGVADRWHLLANGSIVESGVAGDHAALEAAYLASMTGSVTTK
ncbi:ABC transporter ATP-binding protein [Streptomyces sp. NPDC001978]|uniref:ABC transporter ATP-binding protein n=1 Tax=Streptomyces sp. NPDC001978 TaxID=3364627 RepID=UPI003699B70E